MFSRLDRRRALLTASAFGGAGLLPAAAQAALAVTSLFRNPLLPEVPSVSEAGYPGFVVVASRSADYSAFVRSEASRWGRVVRAAGIKAG